MNEATEKSPNQENCNYFEISPSSKFSKRMIAIANIFIKSI